MSIAPVKPSPTVVSEPPENTSVHKGTQAAPTPEVDKETTQSVSGTSPKQETSAAKKVTPTYTWPQDVVEVHQDPDIKDQIIVQYLDKSKNVILQVPSSGELTVEHGIEQESQQAAKLHASAETAAEASSEAGKDHGNKL